MKTIPVKMLNKLASIPMYVDDWDYEILKEKRWHILVSKISKGGTRCNFYPATTSKNISILAHRIILWCPKGLQIDHIDGNPCNNQMSNLRVCTHSQNIQNRGKLSTNTSGYKGVSWHKRDKIWRAQIAVNGRYIYLGSFDTAKEAHKAYKNASIKYHGEFASY